MIDLNASALNKTPNQRVADRALTEKTQRNLTLAVILLATLNALLWSFVRLPGLGGPDEAEHFRIVQQMILMNVVFVVVIILVVQTVLAYQMVAV